MANTFCKPRSPNKLPNAKAKLAKLMVKMVKIKSFDDFIYLFVSKRIMKLISDNEAARIIILVKK